MTRRDLINITLNEMSKGTKNTVRINQCKAFIETVTPNFYIVVSYYTPVAVYVKTTGTMYVFGFYSTTTQMHIRKAADILDPMRITYLYQRSDKYVEIARDGRANSLRPSKEEWLNILDSDYSLVIGEKSILKSLGH